MTVADIPPFGDPPRSWFDLAAPVRGHRWEVRAHDAEIIDRWRTALEAGDGVEVDRIVSASREDRTRPSSRSVRDGLLGRRSDQPGEPPW
jgi:hypothetical protein